MAIDIVARGLAASLVGSNGKISSDKMPTLNAVPEGTTFYPIGQLSDPSLVAGKTAEEILLMMLYGIVNPTFVDPSLGISLSDENAALIIGRPSALKGTLTFDRGKIEPAYDTTGFRTGLPISYSIGDIVIESNNTQYNFEIDLTPTDKTVFLNYGVKYNEGEQPTNSIGQNVDSPYPAGELNFTISLAAVYPLYNVNGEDHPFSWFEDKDGEQGYLAVFDSETDGTRQSFAVSSEMNVIGVKGFNALTEQWEWIGSQTAAISLTYFDTTIIPGENLGESTDYILYSYNATPVGERELRIYVE